MISFVLAADGSADDLLASVMALAEAVDELERVGTTPSVWIVPTTSAEARVSETLHAIEGATILASRRNVALAWQFGLEQASDQLVWFGSTSLRATFAGFAAALEQLHSSAYQVSDSSVLAHRGAVIASGGPGRFASQDSPSEVLRNLAENMPTEQSPSWGQAASSAGFAQATIDITHPSALQIGAHSYTGSGSLIRSAHAANRITIGSYCSFSGQVQVLALRPRTRRFFDAKDDTPVVFGLLHDHRPETATTFPVSILVPEAPYESVPDDGSIYGDELTIGNDVWIGWGARIVGPLNIGHGAVVSAEAVVLGDVPPYSVVAGNPAKVIRTRFSSETIERLLKLQWWDWPEAKVKANWWWFTRPAVEFLDHFENEM